MVSVHEKNGSARIAKYLLTKGLQFSYAENDSGKEWAGCTCWLFQRNAKSTQSENCQSLNSKVKRPNPDSAEELHKPGQS